MIDIDPTEVLNLYLSGLTLLVEPIKPYIINAIFVAIVIFMLKCALHRLHDFFYFYQSSREQKAAHKRIDNAVDFISNLSDLISMSNSDKRQR
ncbi:MAG: hypothetical protein ACI4I6_07910 [Hominimerdicola sp.]